MNEFESVLRQKPVKRVSIFSLRTVYPAYIVLVFFLGLTFVGWKVFDRVVTSEHRTTFEKAVESVRLRLQRATDAHINIVRSMKELFRSSFFIVRDVFEFYGSIAPKTFPSVQSVMFVPQILRENIPQFVHYAKSERYYDYTVIPDTVFAVNYPVFYVVPVEQNEAIIGYNFAADSLTAAAIAKAMLSPMLITATPFLQIRPGLQGFRLFSYVVNQSTIELPLAWEKITGVVGVEVKGPEFFRYAFSEVVPTDTLIAFTLVQRKDNGMVDTVYSSANFSEIRTVAYLPKFSEEYRIEIADQQLLLRIQTVPEFGKSLLSYAPVITLAGGSLLSFLLFAFVYSLLSSRARAEEIAERMTAAQRRILAGSHDIIAVVDQNFKVEAMNEAVREILHYSSSEMLHKNLAEFIDPQDQEHFRSQLQAASPDTPVLLEVRMSTKEGETRWISWNCTLDHTTGFFYMIGRDITVQKHEELAIRQLNQQLDLARLDSLVATQRLVELNAEIKRIVASDLFRLREEIENLVSGASTVNNTVTSQNTELFETVQRVYSNLIEVLNTSADVVRVRFSRTGLSLDPELIQLIEDARKKYDMVEYFQLTPNPFMKDFAVEANKEDLETSFASLFSILRQFQIQGEIQFELNPYDRVLEVQLLLYTNAAFQEIISMVEELDLGHSWEGRLIEPSVLSLLKSKMLFRKEGGELLVDVLDADMILLRVIFPVLKMEKKVYSTIS